MYDQEYLCRFVDNELQMFATEIINRAFAPEVLPYGNSYSRNLQASRPRGIKYPAKPVDRWLMGVRSGQAHDPTAICVLHHQRIPLGSWRVDNAKGTTRQEIEEGFYVKHLQRLPLGMSYPEQVQVVADLLARPPLREAEIIIDETAIGRAVGDIFNAAGLKPNRVTITSGSEQVDQGNDRWHVSKGILVSNVDARLHTGELRFAAALSEAGAMKDG